MHPKCQPSSWVSSPPLGPSPSPDSQPHESMLPARHAPSAVSFLGLIQVGTQKMHCKLVADMETIGRRQLSSVACPSMGLMRSWRTETPLHGLEALSLGMSGPLHVACKNEHTTPGTALHELEFAFGEWSIRPLHQQRQLRRVGSLHCQL